MFVLLWSQSRIIEATYGVAPQAWRRQLALMPDAYRAEGARPLLEPPLTPTQMKQATARSTECPDRAASCCYQRTADYRRAREEVGGRA
jgi:hypothetical protein